MYTQSPNRQDRRQASDRRAETGLSCGRIVPSNCSAIRTSSFMMNSAEDAAGPHDERKRTKPIPAIRCGVDFFSVLSSGLTGNELTILPINQSSKKSSALGR